MTTLHESPSDESGVTEATTGPSGSSAASNMTNDRGRNTTGVLEYHPAASIVPTLSSEEQTALTEDIRKHGLRFPITLYEGKILDGRHRHRACLDAGVEPRFQEYDGTDPAAFVISAAVHRRHLS